jgi:hypothetical protein
MTNRKAVYAKVLESNNIKVTRSSPISFNIRLEVPVSAFKKERNKQHTDGGDIKWSIFTNDITK